MMTINQNNPRPNLPDRLFWEVNLETQNWQDGYQFVIERVLDRGDEKEVDELIRFYGLEKVLSVFTSAPIYLMEHSLEMACKRFGIKKEDTLCYQRKMARGDTWV
jgi:hypothetical protein